MSDPYTGARAPDATTGYGEVPVQPVETYPATGVTQESLTTSTTTTGGGSGAKEQAKQVAGESAQATKQAAGEVKDTAKEQVQRVGAEAKTQARNIASDVRDKVSTQAQSQNDKLVGGIRQMADHLEEMRGDRQDSPAATVVSRIADGGRQMADYLESNGPEGVLREVTDFARRRPGAFLATALAAGFVVGRLGKGVMKADDTAGKPQSDSFYSGTGTSTSYGTGYDTTAGAAYDSGYAAGTTGTGYTTGTTAGAGYAAGTTGTGYVDPSVENTGYTTGTEYASTGTGTPVVVEEEYPGGTTGGTR